LTNFEVKLDDAGADLAVLERIKAKLLDKAAKQQQRKRSTDRQKRRRPAAPPPDMTTTMTTANTQKTHGKRRSTAKGLTDFNEECKRCGIY